MSLTSQEIEDAPKIKLGGVDYSIPKLAPRQQRIVIPRLMGMMKELMVDGKIAMKDVSEAQYDTLVDIVAAAVSRARPEITREAFLDIECDTRDLITSLSVIATQTGMLGRAAPGETPKGEAQAVSSNSPIGTASSQE